MHFPALFLLSLFFPVAGAASDALVVRQVRTFDIEFLTEQIPDFPLEPAPLRRGLELTAPDEASGFTSGDMGFSPFSDEDARQDWDVASQSPLSVHSTDAMVPVSVFSGSEDEDPAGSLGRITPGNLVALIKRNIAEDSWANTRNVIEADAAFLMVRQTPDVLNEIEALLKTLRARRACMTNIEVAVVPASLLGEKQRAASPWISSREFDALLARAGKQGKKLSLTAYNRQTVSAHSGERRSILTDFDVNQTGVVPVINPLLEVISLGVLVQVRPMAITGSGWTGLQLEVIERRLTDKPIQHTGPYGDYEFTSVAEARLVTEVVVENGNGMIAGYIEGPLEGIEPKAVLCRVHSMSLTEVQVQKQKAGQDTFYTQRYDLEPVFRCAGQGADPFSRLPANPRDVVTLITYGIALDSWNDARAKIDANEKQLVVCQRRPVHDKIKECVGEWIRKAQEMVRVETWTLSGTPNAVSAFLSRAGPGGSLGEAWRAAALNHELEIKTHTCITGLMGKMLSLIGWVTQTFIADYESVAGGTTYMPSGLPDPIIDAAGSGLTQYSRVYSLPSETAMVDLAAVQSKTVFKDRGLVMAPWELMPSVSSGLSSPAKKGDKEGDAADDAESEKGKQEEVLSPGQVYVFVPATVDLPRQQLWKVNRRSRVRWNEPTIIEAHTVPSKGTIAHVMVVLVSRWNRLHGEGGADAKAR